MWAAYVPCTWNVLEAGKKSRDQGDFVLSFQNVGPPNLFPPYCCTVYSYSECQKKDRKCFLFIAAQKQEKLNYTSIISVSHKEIQARFTLPLLFIMKLKSYYVCFFFILEYQAIESDIILDV